MANLGTILGAMLATGMAGRSHRGPALASSLLGGRTMRPRSSFAQKAGLAALGYLAYKGYKNYQRNNRGAAPLQEPSDSQGGSLGDRLAALLRPDQRRTPDPPIADQKALLLIRAMIAAANADGVITAEERATILARLDEAGASAEDHGFLESELAAPRSMDALLREVKDEETAEQVYVASAMAIDPDTPAERSYLGYLAARLNIDPQRAQELAPPGA